MRTLRRILAVSPIFLLAVAIPIAAPAADSPLAPMLTAWQSGLPTSTEAPVGPPPWEYDMEQFLALHQQGDVPECVAWYQDKSGTEPHITMQLPRPAASTAESPLITVPGDDQKLWWGPCPAETSFSEQDDDLDESEAELPAEPPG